jgi:hypothetical protein
LSLIVALSVQLILPKEKTFGSFPAATSITSDVSIRGCWISVVRVHYGKPSSASQAVQDRVDLIFSNVVVEKRGKKSPYLHLPFQ